MIEIFEIIRNDLKIPKYYNESTQSYISRFVYSALGSWCLISGKKTINNKNGISKAGQTRLVNSILERLMLIEPCIKDYFYLDEEKNKNNFSVFLRNIYEETGYFLTDEDNYNILNEGNEFITLSDNKNLFFGVPNRSFIMNGLGVNISGTLNEYTEENKKEFLIRDDLTPNEFIDVNYNECNFVKKEISRNDLEFFNPNINFNIHKSWSNNIHSNKTIARTIETNEYFKVIRDKSGEILFSESLHNNHTREEMSGLEYNRVYLALRKYYNNPPIVKIKRIDDNYSELSLFCSIPNREYFYLLLNGWPKNRFNERYNFIIRNYSIDSCSELLKNIGFIVN